MSGIWVFIDERTDFIFPESFLNTTLLCISDVSEMTYAQLGKLLRNYKTEQFFYDYQPIHRVNHKRAYELREDEYITDDAAMEKLKSDWISLNWIYENELFDKIKFDLKNSKLKFSKLYHLLLTLENLWNTSYSSMTGQTLELPPTFHYWSEVEDWLIQVYEKTNLINSSGKYSPEVSRHIFLAKRYIDTNYSAFIDVTEVARDAHMSYGYFSRCFHELVGSSVSDYITQVRIKNAQEYLTCTSNSIQQIASDVGYSDEKYFSRIFKKIMGCTPSEYRKSRHVHGSDT